MEECVFKDVGGRNNLEIKFAWKKHWLAFGIHIEVNEATIYLSNRKHLRFQNKPKRINVKSQPYAFIILFDFDGEPFNSHLLMG